MSPVEGVTRDRIFDSMEWSGKKYNIIDTGGYLPDTDDKIEKAVRKQAELAYSEADFILVENKKRKTNYLVCKYHGWTYSINGQLKSPRGFNKSEIALEELCLKYINTKVWKGLIFINFSDKPKNFGATFKNIERI